jgi:plastocyanin
VRVLALLLVALAVPVASGCGGGDEAGDAGAVQTVEISETDFALEPETVNLDEAGTYTFRAVNNGDAPHALEIEGGGIEEKTEEIQPGESAELTVELDTGEYEMYCPVGDHKDRGMVGTVVVGGGTGGGGAGTTETGETDTGETTTGETDTGETTTGDDSRY